MKMFRGLSNWIGMDMGSSQVRIYRENKVILAEASTVAVDNIDGHVLGFGTEALIHYHKAPENISLEWPVQNGVIADYAQENRDYRSKGQGAQNVRGAACNEV